MSSTGATSSTRRHPGSGASELKTRKKDIDDLMHVLSLLFVVVAAYSQKSK
jgi:hypothetical protein